MQCELVFAKTIPKKEERQSPQATKPGEKNQNSPKPTKAPTGEHRNKLNQHLNHRKRKNKQNRKKLVTRKNKTSVGGAGEATPTPVGQPPKGAIINTQHHSVASFSPESIDGASPIALAGTNSSTQS